MAAEVKPKSIQDAEDGRSFAAVYARLVSSTAYLVGRIKTGSTPAKFFFSFSSTGKSRVELASIDGWTEPGTLLTPTPLNGNTASSPAFEVYADPGAPLGVYRSVIPSTGTDNGRGLVFIGKQMLSCGGLILELNSEYIIGMLNLEASELLLGYVVYGITRD
jgi:hypothetical protein